MHFSFKPINKEYAEMIQSWDYDEEFTCYDTEKNPLSLDEVMRTNAFKCFVSLDEADEPVGFLAITFGDDGMMEMENFLNPDVIGQGIGVDFISECLDFVIDYYEYDKTVITLVVEAHNKRAIKVYERAGFQVSDECDEWVEMEIDI